MFILLDDCLHFSGYAQITKIDFSKLRAYLICDEDYLEDAVIANFALRNKYGD